MAIDVCTRFGERVRQLRKERGWRQLDLAEHAGISENYVSDLELGRKEACLRTILALAEALGVTVSEMMQSVR
ncbi:helix-turn-helix domain-containing protein [Amaricoccus sp.]|uniref:helix-turn-helix domain-containing protein n=1 Tax=Amaricoccus sp. TaxID=1872485 RepID=UPI0039E6C59F